MQDGKKRSEAAAGESFMGKIRRFIAETVAELGRCTWPSKQQLLESTVLVVVVMAVLALFVAGVDLVAEYVIRLVTIG